MREVLGNLAKGTKRGSPEEAVASLAARARDGFGNYLQIGSRSLIDQEILGNPVTMDGRPMVAAERVVTSDGEVGAFIDESEEERTLRRWSERVFSDEERERAALYRAEAKGNTTLQTIIQNFARGRTKGMAYPTTLEEVVAAVDAFLDHPGTQFRTLKTVLELFDQPQGSVKHVRAMWTSNTYRRTPIRYFLPYSYYCTRLVLVFRYAVALGVLGQRPTNTIDLEYLLYLPFCRVFSSTDDLHRSLAPLFMAPTQRFVDGDTLKAGLAELARYYCDHEEELRRQGSMRFAEYPPLSLATCVHELYDHFDPQWRKRAIEPREPISKEENDRIMAKLRPKIEAFERARQGVGGKRGI